LPFVLWQHVLCKDRVSEGAWRLNRLKAMNALLSIDKDMDALARRCVTEQTGVSPARDAEEFLLAEIGRLGGMERRKAAEGALGVFQSALAELVRKNPKTYGAADDPESQERVVAELTASVRISFLEKTLETLRCDAGYVMIAGRWIHRAVLTFVVFGLLAAGLLPVCAVSLMSGAQWGWVPGVVGILGALLAGAWILSRVRAR
jgi:hypothetical protein